MENKKGDKGDGRKLLVVTDGSRKSKEAFYVNLTILFLYVIKSAYKQFYRKGDHIIILHVLNSNKNYLTAEFKPAAIRNFFKIELLTSVPKTHYKIIMADKEEGKPIKE